MTTTVKECTACAATGGPATVTVTMPVTSNGPVAPSVKAGTTTVVTTIAGQATTTTISAANFAAVSTSNGVPVGAILPSSSNSTANGTVAGPAMPSMQSYLGEGETLRVASGLFCVVLLVIAMIL